MTETKKPGVSDPRGVLFYDGTCRFCIGSVNRMRPFLDRIRVEPRPFENGAAEPEMKLKWEDESWRGGGDVIFFLARRRWWSAPLGWLEWVPGARWLMGRFYEAVASRRHCLGDGMCRI